MKTVRTLDTFRDNQKGEIPIIQRPLTWVEPKAKETRTGVRVAPAAVKHRKIAPLHESRLLHFVQFLVNQHRQEREQKHSGTDAEHPHGKSQLVDFR